MSRVYRCDYCKGVIEWEDGSRTGDPPPITVRGRGLVLDFCCVQCMAEWGKENPEAGPKKTPRRKAF